MPDPRLLASQHLVATDYLPSILRESNDDENCQHLRPETHHNQRADQH